MATKGERATLDQEVAAIQMDQRQKFSSWTSLPKDYTANFDLTAGICERGKEV